MTQRLLAGIVILTLAASCSSGGSGDGSPESATPPPTTATVKLLRRLDTLTTYETQPMTVMVDGMAVAQLPSADAIPNLSYTVTAGSHAYSDNVTTATYTAKFDAGSKYVQHFGRYQPGTFYSPFIWLPPEVANDYPAPADVARVRLIIDNSPGSACNADTLIVDGTSYTYGTPQWGDAGPTIDHAPGNVQVEVLVRGASAGLQVIPVKASHYYVFHSLNTFSNFPGPSGCSGDHAFTEISGDE
jgi:hypothetical protein